MDISKNSKDLSESSTISCCWINSSTLRANYMFKNYRAKPEVMKASHKIGSVMNLHIMKSFEWQLLKLKLDYPQVNQTKIMMAALVSCLLVRLMHQHHGKLATVALQQLLSSIIRSFAAPGLPFACMSDSLNKPTPLQLDVSLPSWNDIKWNFSRLAYLFDIQLERNVSTFLIVLILACFSFVFIGGLLFYKYRYGESGLFNKLLGGSFMQKANDAGRAVDEMALTFLEAHDRSNFKRE
ncbi:hypothetical protein OSB04_029723 [Centaurea solstitialis]|uniref:Uncharacterized protein n=1 Tax=Centaurea solstitialis TaxID=347529 RepID=A0AA38W357_9ASTR|nr:hypothetical protein OSB04_029723 [Centaurea solstitialis]